QRCLRIGAVPPPAPPSPSPTLFRPMVGGLPARLNPGDEPVGQGAAVNARGQQQQACQTYQPDISPLDAAAPPASGGRFPTHRSRSEEHTSELQSRENLVCRPLRDKN